MSTASSASSASTSATSTSSGTCSTPNADEVHLYKIALVDTIRPLLDGIPRTAEPLASTQPSALRILYSSHFDDLMGAYRTMRANPALYGSGARDGATDDSDHDRPPAALWLLLLAFTLRQSTSNYTVWKERRDVVLSPAAFLTAHRDRLPSPAGVGDELARAQSDIEDVAQRWLPHMPRDYHPDGSYSVWRAVRWELTVTEAFAHLYHKQFQVWHHRKELIGAALGSLARHDLHDVLSSELSFDAYLRAHHHMSFAEIDERQMIDYVLLARDPKNYHVWLHRSWYLEALPFLLEPPSWPALCAYVQRVNAASGQSAVPSAAAFRAVSGWRSEKRATEVEATEAHGSSAEEGSSLYVSLPDSPFARELHFTDTAIQADAWNNSAWCHRFLLFKAHLVPSLLARLHSCCSSAEGGADGASAQESRKEVEDVLSALCWQEVYYALQWAAVTPCNECPFVHARSVSELHQTIMLRLAVVNAAAVATGLSGTQQASLLALPLVSPVKSVTAAHEGVGDNTPQSVAPVGSLRELSALLTWPDYLSSFTLVNYVLDVTRVHLAPLADSVVTALESVAALRDITEREAAARRLFDSGCGAQYVLDNLHQVVAAEYHALFYFLEQCWLLFFTETAREAICTERPSSAYARDGISEALEDAAAQCLARLEEHPAPTATAVFLAQEVRALTCVKTLHAVDTIRSKYWRHEASVVLHRDY